MPLRALVTLDRLPEFVLILALAGLLIAAWALAALAFRRAADAGVTEWIAPAAYAIVPVIQIWVILLLCVLPSRAAPDRPPATDLFGAPEQAWAAVAQGALAGMGLTLFAVAISALLFRVYGFGLFVLAPLLIGAAAGYFANRRGDIGGSSTATVVVWATALGGIALIATALEGVICIVLAAPLALGVGLIGGLLGRAVASASRSPAQTVSSLALLPLVFAVESVIGPTSSFDTVQTVTVRAPPAVVWKSVLHMDPIEGPLALPFRLGVAYPLRGEVIGEGVGALRRGEFSTGTALERVTEWTPERKLAFVVLNEVPAMRELSPYQHVHAPHLVGYFRTTSTSFELSPRSDGGTDVVERTSHELRLEPALYWLPMARWMVHANNARVLAHIRGHAERSTAPGN